METPTHSRPVAEHLSPHTSPSPWRAFVLLFSLALLVTVRTNITPPSVTGKVPSPRPRANATATLPRQRRAGCDAFDHGDGAPASAAASPFNCGAAGGACAWYHPARFLDRACGVGRDYHPLLEEAERRRRENRLWGGMVPILLPSVSLSPDVQRTAGSTPFPRHNLTLIHVHKTGGTSLVVAYGRLGQRGAKTTWHCAYSPTESQDANTTTIHAAAATFLSGAVKYQQTWDAKQHTLFAVVRDPAERFISAIGQATGGRGTRRDGLARRLRDACVKGTSAATLRCFADLVAREGTWVELHFAPMVLELSFATLRRDVPVAVFPFAALPSLLEEFDAAPGENRKGGGGAGVRADRVLRDMTPEDYDEDALRTVCDLYAMDVALLRHLGHGSRCDRFA